MLRNVVTRATQAAASISPVTRSWIIYGACATITYGYLYAKQEKYKLETEERIVLSLMWQGVVPFGAFCHFLDGCGKLMMSKSNISKKDTGLGWWDV